eukprot:gene9160-10749_t
MSSYSDTKTTHRRMGGIGSSRSKSVSVFQLQFADGPQQKTAQQKPYSIPRKKAEEFTSKLKDRTPGEPMFMTADGGFYDVNYVHVFKHKLPERLNNNNNNNNNNNGTTRAFHTSDGYTAPDAEDNEEQEESFQEQLHHLYNSIPQIDEFENFFDYEQAFLGWKFAVETLFADVRLPLSTGRAYYRPKVSDYQRVRDTSGGFGDYRPSVSSFSNEADSDEKSDAMIGEMEDDINLTDSTEYDLNIRDIENTSEPWDSYLYPQEPQPADYDTFDDYNDALIRWASLCASQPFFPPHAAQLKELIPIQAIAEHHSNNLETAVLPGDSKSEQAAKQSLPIKSGIKELVFFDEPLPRLVHRPVVSTPQYSKEAIYMPTDATKRSILSQLNNITLKRSQNLQIHKWIVAPLLPRIHGTLPQMIMPSLAKPSNSPKATPLRRTDLTADQLKSCLDCPAKVGGQTIEFKIPAHDVSYDVSRLYIDPTFPAVLNSQLKTFLSADRYNKLYSWYHPLVSSSTHQKHRDDIDSLITAQQRITKDTLTIPCISEILYGGMFLDKFSDMLDTSFSEDFDGGKSYATVITKCISPDNIGELLILLQRSKSPLFHAKMSYLVMNLFSGNQGSPILVRLIETKDISNLSLLTYAFDYLSDLPVDLYPWTNETLETVKLAIGDSIDSIFKLIFSYYYLTVIGRGMAIHNCLRADSSFLFERIKRVCDSKLKHVQFAARRLFAVLSRAPWIDFIYKEYTREPDSAIRDLIGSDDQRPTNLQLELVLEFFSTALDRTMEAANASLPISNTTVNTTPPLSPVGSPPTLSSSSTSISGMSTLTPNVTIGIRNKFLFVLDGLLFHTLLQFVMKNCKTTSYQLFALSTLMAKLSRSHCKLGTIQATQDVKSSQKKWGTPLLSLSPIDIRGMSSRIGDFQASPTNPLSSSIRKIYDIIKKEEDFYSRLLGFCRDGASAEFNKEAWCLLYQIMKNHSGTLETLSKDAVLQGFMELVGTSSHTTVITNGLHYITKMFNITNVKNTPQRTKNDLKVIEKDLKALNSLFISKRLFIKIHMIYKKYINTQPGLAFIELAKFYNLMYASPNCSKLFKDTIKKSEYKEGLEKIGNMFDPSGEVSSPQESSGSPATSSPSTVSSLKSMFLRSSPTLK